MSIAQEIVGKWNLVDSENFDEYMKEVGVSFMTRKIAGNLKPQLEFIVNGDDWQWTSVSTFKTHVVKFKLGETFDEKTADGREVTSTYSIDGDKLMQQEKAKSGGKDSVLERVIKDGKLVITCKSGNVTCVRTYERAA